MTIPASPGARGANWWRRDVQYTFQRICDPKVECPVFANLSGYVAGMDDAAAAAKKNGDVFDYDKMKVSGIEVIDPHTFKLHLLKAYPQIRYWLAMNFTAPVAREGAEYYDGKPHPDGRDGAIVTRPLFKFHPGRRRAVSKSRSTFPTSATGWCAIRGLSHHRLPQRRLAAGARGGQPSARGARASPGG